MKLRTTILLTILCVIAAILVPVGIILQDMLETQARAELTDRLERTQVVFEDLHAFRQDELAAEAKVTAEEPRVKAVVATDEVEHATIIDVALELRSTLGSDLFIIADGSGTLLADTAEPAATGHDMSGLPIVAASMREGRAAAVWTDDRGIYQMQAERMEFGETAVGHLIIGDAIGDDVARTVLRETGSSVFIQTDGKTVGAAVTEGQDATALAEAVAALPRESGTHELRIGAERFVVVVRPLPGYAGEADVRYVVCRSLDLALAASDRTSELLYLVGAIGFGLAIILSIVTAWRLTRPVETLVAFTQRIAAGDLSARTSPRGAKEIRSLGTAMNRMAEQLTTSKEEVERTNAGLERMVAERTAEIGEMLDNLHDGLFIVDESGRVVGRPSPACAAILGCAPDGLDAHALLFAASRVDADRVAAHGFSLQSSFGAPAFQWELNADHLIRSLEFPRRDGSVRALELRYAPLYDADENVARVMVIVSDVTEIAELKRIVEQEQQRNEERMGILLEVLACPASFVVEFVDDNADRAMRIVEDVALWQAAREPEALTRAFRELHTIKGNARTLGLGRISVLTHEVEETVQALRDGKRIEDEDALGKGVDRLFALLEEYRSVVEGTLRGRDAAGLVKADGVIARLSWLADGVARHDAAMAQTIDRIAELIDAESRDEVTSVNDLFEHHLLLSREIAAKLGKELRVDGCVERGRDLYVSQAIARVLRDAANHAIRNALDHGIEAPTERAAAGKAAHGTVRLTWCEHPDRFQLDIRDDGRGVDINALLRTAKARGLVAEDASPTADETIDLLFLPGFSTKGVVTDVSGRGVGLDAIRAALRKLGGDVRLVSTPGRGTVLELDVPRTAIAYVAVDGQVDRPDETRAAA